MLLIELSRRQSFVTERLRRKRSAKAYNYTEPSFTSAHFRARGPNPSPQPSCLSLLRPPMSSQPSKSLETFANPAPGRDFVIHMEVPEFTCLCPLTGQPDFASIIIDYIPDATCVELKSLKLYMWSYRNEGAFHEAVTNRIVDDLVAASAPRFARVTAKWYVRGGIFTNVIVEHRKPGWTPAPPVDLPAFAASSPMAAADAPVIAG